MGTMTFRFMDGKSREVAYAAGRSVMLTAIDNGIPGIEGECGGEMTCGTCHVYVDQGWARRLSAPRRDELDMLDVVEKPTEHSRLGCQIKLNDDLDGLVVTVPDPE
jgi:2Fe-2S ferredoxin